MSDVVKFPVKDDRPLLAGPFQEWRVIVSGRRIPRLTGRQAADGGITLLIDDRFSGGPFHGEAAHQAAYLIAQALAVGSGYSHFEADARDAPFAPLAMQLDSESAAVIGTPQE